MKVITSQGYRDEGIVEAKKAELKKNGTTEITLPVVSTYMDDLYILIDGHHTYAAAKELGIEINFEEVEDEKSYYSDIENKNTDGILEAHYMDSDWTYLEDGTLVF